MASLRKRYVDRIEATPHQDALPVASPPEITAAELPPPATDAKPPEQPDTESPAEKAAQAEITKRLAEMENAEHLAREAQQPQPHVAEPPPQQPVDPLEQAIADLPPRVQRWYRAHPELLTDPEQAAKLQYVHHIVAREVGEQFTDPYFDRMESMLGLAPSGNGQAQRPAPSAPPPAQHSPPPRQQPTRPMPVSAPPSREPPSMATGRAPSRRAPLTRDELEIAAASGMTAEQYQAQKERMLRMKAAGEMQ